MTDFNHPPAVSAGQCHVRFMDR